MRARVQLCQAQGRGKCGRMARVWAEKRWRAPYNDAPQKKIVAACRGCAAELAVIAPIIEQQEEAA